MRDGGGSDIAADGGGGDIAAAPRGRWLSGLFQPAMLGRAAATFVPSLLLFLVTRDAGALRIGLVTLSLARVAESVAPSVALLALQWVAIALCMVLFVLAMADAALLAVAAAAIAAAGVWLMRFGAEKRVLGTWTFIPSLYLACDQTTHGADWPALLRLLAWWPLSLAAVLAVFLPWRAWRGGPGAARAAPTLRALFTPAAETAAERFRREGMMLTVAGAVAVAALYARLAGVAHAEWAIWSSASVVTGGLGSTGRKFRDRLIGAAIGVPLGLLAAPFVADTAVAHALIAVAMPLTIVAFTSYTVGFACRSGLAVMFAGAGGTLSTGAARFDNVGVGGLIGIVIAVAVNLAWRHRVARAAVPATPGEAPR